MTKISTICIDTLTQIQENQYMTDKKKPGHDKWKDYGQEIFRLINSLQDRGFEIILVLGPPGVGKSTGMRHLPSKTNIWFNADNKNPVWEGGRAEYGKKTAPIEPYHIIPKTYKDITDMLDEGLKADKFETDRYAILSGHTETFKEGIETRVRLKTLGQLSNKMQVEGKLETVFYANVEKDGDDLNYILETQNSGHNTARSPMGLFEGKIENDYNFIINKLKDY